ncbi:MAG: hypothetical protein AB1941_19155 [Gemmatimonadota bacterium]
MKIKAAEIVLSPWELALLLGFLAALMGLRYLPEALAVPLAPGPITTPIGAAAGAAGVRSGETAAPGSSRTRDLGEARALAPP